MSASYAPRHPLSLHNDWKDGGEIPSNNFFRPLKNNTMIYHRHKKIGVPRFPEQIDKSKNKMLEQDDDLPYDIGDNDDNHEFSSVTDSCMTPVFHSDDSAKQVQRSHSVDSDDIAKPFDEESISDYENKYEYNKMGRFGGRVITPESVQKISRDHALSPVFSDDVDDESDNDTKSTKIPDLSKFRPKEETSNRNNIWKKNYGIEDGEGRGTSNSNIFNDVMNRKLPRHGRTRSFPNDFLSTDRCSDHGGKPILVTPRGTYIRHARAGSESATTLVEIMNDIPFNVNSSSSIMMPQERINKSDAEKINFKVGEELVNGRNKLKNTTSVRNTSNADEFFDCTCSINAEQNDERNGLDEGDGDFVKNNHSLSNCISEETDKLIKYDYVADNKEHEKGNSLFEGSVLNNETCNADSGSTQKGDISLTVALNQINHAGVVSEVKVTDYGMNNDITLHYQKSQTDEEEDAPFDEESAIVAPQKIDENVGSIIRRRFQQSKRASSGVKVTFFETDVPKEKRTYADESSHSKSTDSATITHSGYNNEKNIPDAETFFGKQRHVSADQVDFRSPYDEKKLKSGFINEIDDRSSDCEQLSPDMVPLSKVLNNTRPTPPYRPLSFQSTNSANDTTQDLIITDRKNNGINPPHNGQLLYESLSKLTSGNGSIVNDSFASIHKPNPTTKKEGSYRRESIHTISSRKDEWNTAEEEWHAAEKRAMEKNGDQLNNGTGYEDGDSFDQMKKDTEPHSNNRRHVIEKHSHTQRRRRHHSSVISDDLSETSSIVSEFWEVAEETIKKKFSTDIGDRESVQQKDVYIGTNNSTSDHQIFLDPSSSKGSEAPKYTSFEKTLPVNTVEQSLCSHLTLDPCLKIEDDEDSILNLTDQEVDPKKSNFKNLNDKAALKRVKRDKVGFVRDDENIVHHFVVEQENNEALSSGTDDESIFSEETYDENDIDSRATNDSRFSFNSRYSYNSVYSKSTMSEVEDAVKDILFIGRGIHSTPGKRKIKHRPEMKAMRKYKQHEKERRRVNKASVIKKKNELLCNDECCDNDFQSSPRRKKKGQRHQDDTAMANAFLNLEVSDSLQWMWGTVEDGIQSLGAAFGLSNTPPEEAQVHKKIVQKEEPTKSKREATSKQEKYGTKRFAERMEFGKRMKIEKRDLEQLVRCATQTKHKSVGVEHDGSYVDIHSDIIFSSITVALPLGILFQENFAGCWVTRVFKSGNAAASVRGNVEVGDQLAAVNGRSTFAMKIDKICALISASPNPKEIELTFLRYVGPIRPVLVEESQTERSDIEESDDENFIERQTSYNFDHHTKQIVVARPPPPPPPRAQIGNNRNTVSITKLEENLEKEEICKPILKDGDNSPKEEENDDINTGDESKLSGQNNVVKSDNLINQEREQTEDSLNDDVDTVSSNSTVEKHEVPSEIKTDLQKVDGKKKIRRMKKLNPFNILKKKK